MGNVFDKDGNEIRTIAVFHPGEFLLEEIEERGLKKTDFAAEIKMLPSNLSELFSGKRNITAIIAVRLEKALGISAEYWIGLQQLMIFQKREKLNTLNNSYKCLRPGPQYPIEKA